MKIICSYTFGVHTRLTEKKIDKLDMKLRKGKL